MATLDTTPQGSVGYRPKSCARVPHAIWTSGKLPSVHLIDITDCSPVIDLDRDQWSEIVPPAHVIAARNRP